MIDMNERGEQEDALVRVVDVFDAIGMNYLLTGSLAASIHGMPRMTRDVDILIDPGPEHRRPLQKALQEDFDTDPYVVDLALRERSMFNVLDPHTFAKIDLVVRDRKRDPDEIMHRGITVEIRGRLVRTISPEDLILAKLRWALTSRSVMQLRDVHYLLRLPGLDEPYLQERILKYRLMEILEEARDPRYG